MLGHVILQVSQAPPRSAAHADQAAGEQGAGSFMIAEDLRHIEPRMLRDHALLARGAPPGTPGLKEQGPGAWGGPGPGRPSPVSRPRATADGPRLRRRRGGGDPTRR